MFDLVWQILPQEDGTQVREIKMYPKHDKDGKLTGFGYLKHPIRQVLVGVGSGEPLKLQHSTAGWAIIWPDKTAPATIKVKGREALDHFAPAKRVRGERETYLALNNFKRKLIEMGMERIVEEAITLLT